MGKTFVINKSPYNEGEILYRKSEILLEPGVTVLVGCNGSGKTTMLRAIQRQLRDANIPFIFYDNLQDGGTRAREIAVWNQNAALAGTLMCSSEGEQIQINIGTIAGQLGQLVRRNRGAKELFVLLDAVDSGLSIDNIQDVKTYLFDIVLEDAAPTEVYIIVSANGYEFCRGERCFDVRKGVYREFKSYEAYRNFILRSSRDKDARYQQAEIRRSKKKGVNE